MKELIHQLNKVFNKYKNGKKRMFIFLGFSNVLITNLVLQLILLTGLFSVNISTLFSQIVVNHQPGIQLLLSQRNSFLFLDP